MRTGVSIYNMLIALWVNISSSSLLDNLQKLSYCCRYFTNLYLAYLSWWCRVSNKVVWVSAYGKAWSPERWGIILADLGFCFRSMWFINIMRTSLFASIFGVCLVRKAINLYLSFIKLWMQNGSRLFARAFLKWTDLKFMSLKLFSSLVVCFGIILLTTSSLFKRVVVMN